MTPFYRMAVLDGYDVGFSVAGLDDEAGGAACSVQGEDGGWVQAERRRVEAFEYPFGCVFYVRVVV